HGVAARFPACQSGRHLAANRYSVPLQPRSHSSARRIVTESPRPRSRTQTFPITSTRTKDEDDSQKQTISPCPAFRSSRDKWGMGVRQALFPMPTLGAPLSGAVSFPTPFSTASGVFGLVAGPSSALRPLDFE